MRYNGKALFSKIYNLSKIIVFTVHHAFSPFIQKGATFTFTMDEAILRIRGLLLQEMRLKEQLCFFYCWPLRKEDIIDNCRVTSKKMMPIQLKHFQSP